MIEQYGYNWTLDVSGYYISTTKIATTGRKEKLHRYVYVIHNGAIPKGYVVHHIDHNKQHNHIDNLQLMTASQHANYHAEDTKIKEWGIIGRENAKKWHSTEEGIAWHTKHIFESLRKSIKHEEITCKECGTKAIKVSHKMDDKFCSRKCANKQARDAGKYKEERVCVICNSTYKTMKYTKTTTCSRSCTNKSRVKGN